MSARPLPGKMATTSAPARRQPPGAMTEPDGNRPVCPRVRARLAAARIWSAAVAGADITTTAGSSTGTRLAVIRHPGQLPRMACARSPDALTHTMLAAGVISITCAGKTMATLSWCCRHQEAARQAIPCTHSASTPQVRTTRIGPVLKLGTPVCILGSAGSAVLRRSRFVCSLMRPAKDQCTGRTSRTNICVKQAISCRYASPTIFVMTGRQAYGV